MVGADPCSGAVGGSGHGRHYAGPARAIAGGALNEQPFTNYSVTVMINAVGVEGGQVLVERTLVEHAALPVERDDLRTEPVRCHLVLEVLCDVGAHRLNPLRRFHEHSHLGRVLAELVSVLIRQARGEIPVRLLDRVLVDVQLDEHLAVFRYEDRPGVIGRIGMAFGDAGVNIVSAAVGRRDEAPGGQAGQAVMIVTTDKAVPRMGVIRGATIIAPITVAVESATTPDVAMTVAKTKSTQNADIFLLVSLPSVRSRRDIIRRTSSAVARMRYSLAGVSELMRQV